ncbi:hypothetical protein L1049_008066 [Liquidambar formosana]|uniref:Apple domain-containing protein n=1 Tax=Liquidambar formosana TaxID=63359 RepID=A0AAP0S343_LIQFO
MPQLSSYFSFKYVSNQEEKYLTLSAYNFVPDSTMSRRLVLNSDGQIVDGGFGLLNGVLDFCNGYKSADSGCASARRVPKCRGRKEGFEKRSGSFVGPSVEGIAQPTHDDNSSLGLGDCWAKCWSDCNCVGFGTWNDNETGCQIWSGNYKFQQDLSGATLARYVIVNPAKGKSNCFSIS